MRKTKQKQTVTPVKRRQLPSGGGEFTRTDSGELKPQQPPIKPATEGEK